MFKIFLLTLLCLFGFSHSFLVGMGGDPMDVDVLAGQLGQINIVAHREQRIALDMRRFNINLALAERFWQSREFFEERRPFSVMRISEVLAFFRIVLQENQAQQNPQLRVYCQAHIQHLQQLLAQHQPALPLHLAQPIDQGEFGGGIAGEMQGF